MFPGTAASTSMATESQSMLHKNGFAVVIQGFVGKRLHALRHRLKRPTVSYLRVQVRNLLNRFFVLFAFGRPRHNHRRYMPCRGDSICGGYHSRNNIASDSNRKVTLTQLVI